MMAGKREQPGEIVLMLRQADVPEGPGQSLSAALRQSGMTVQRCCRWRKD